MKIAPAVLAVCAGLLAMPAVGGAEADPILPRAMPEIIAQLRQTPATPPAPGTQKLTAALLANYVARQQHLRAIDVTQAGPRPPLHTETLMGYIARGTSGQEWDQIFLQGLGEDLDAGNPALSAIDSFTAPPSRPPPSVTPALLRAYIENSYMPTAQRVEIARTERACLAQAIYHEARGESAKGQLAVANVIVNRARSSLYPGSLCDVIYQNADKGPYRCQFTFACDGRADTPRERKAWSRAQTLAAAVYADYATGQAIGALPGSALFYHTTNVRPSWSRSYSQVAQVGAHIFYAPD